jgi:hypothetical protein
MSPDTSVKVVGAAASESRPEHPPCAGTTLKQDRGAHGARRLRSGGRGAASGTKRSAAGRVRSARRLRSPDPPGSASGPRLARHNQNRSWQPRTRVRVSAPLRGGGITAPPGAAHSARMATFTNEQVSVPLGAALCPAPWMASGLGWTPARTRSKDGQARWERASVGAARRSLGRAGASRDWACDSTAVQARRYEKGRRERPGWAGSPPSRTNK